MIIYQSLSFLKDQINAYLRQVLGSEHDQTVIVSNVIGGDGTVPIGAVDKLLITLINIEEEKIGKIQRPHFKLVNGVEEQVNPDLKINLNVLISANKTNYEESLKSLSQVITFFQGTNVFDQENSPTLSTNISKMVMELTTLTLDQINQIWGSIGSKHLPSLMYKVRMLTIQSDKIIASPDAISGTGVLTDN